MARIGTGRTRLTAAVVLAAALAPATAGGAATGPVIDRSPGEPYQLRHETCSGTPLDAVPTTPVLGPQGVPHGAGSLRLDAGDDAFAEYDPPPVPDARTLQHYRLTVMDPHGQVHLAAGVQPDGSASTFITAVVPVAAGTWTVLDLTTLTWQHWSNNQIRLWGAPGVTVDATGPLSHWVPDSGTTDFRPGLVVLGCDSEGGIGPRAVHLDLSDIAGGGIASEQALVDHEPAAAPPTELAASRSARSVARDRVTLSTRLTSAAGWPVTGRTLRLEARTGRRGPWTVVSSGPTDGKGARSVVVRPTRTTTYRWAFAGDPYFAASGSTAVRVTVRTRVKAKTPASVHVGRMLAVTGRTTPAQKGTEVTLWRLGRPRLALDTARVDRRGRFVLATRATGPGTWKLSVTAARTATNAPGRSRTLVVSVRP
jgi:hypothetical protein